MKTHQSILCALSLIAAVTLESPVSAQNRDYFSGAQLKRICNQKDQTPCLLYIMGASDAWYSANSKYGLKLICLPRGATVSNRVSVIKKYLVQHPQHMELAASTLVARALADAFPCKAG